MNKKKKRCVLCGEEKTVEKFPMYKYICWECWPDFYQSKSKKHKTKKQQKTQRIINKYLKNGN